MNHDENNPNPEMKTWIEPELEARVIAWVAGEAAPFEVAELERLCADKPELAIFKRRIEAVHGLVGEAVRPEKQPLRMSTERREKLLAAIGATETTRGAEERAQIPAVLPRAKARPSPWAKQWWLVSAAACAAFAAIWVMQTTPQFKRENRPVRPDAYQSERERDAGAVRVEMPISGEAQAKPDSTYAVQAILADAPAASAPMDLSSLQVSADGLAADYKAKQLKSNVGANIGEVTLGAQSGATSWGGQTPEPPSLRASGSAPFVVSGGYDPRIAESSSTLAGSRISGEFSGQVSGARMTMPAADLDASLNFVTKQTMSDIASGPKSTTSFSTPASQSVAPQSPVKESATEEKVELSAFTVTSSKDSGYAAAAATKGKAGRQRALAKNGAGSALAGGDNYYSGAVGGAIVGEKPGLLAPETRLSRLGQATQERRTAAIRDANVFNEQIFSADKIASVAPARVAEPADAELEAKKRAEDAPLRKEATPLPPPAVDETSTAQEAVSTFSLHVSDVSFRLAQAALNRGDTPDPTRIRPEEFYNAFDYGDPAPATTEKVGARVEQSAHPFLQQRNLLRIAMKVPASGRGAGQPLRLTVLLDTSGSMEREDRAATVRSALQELLALLSAQDRITLIGFARQPRLLAENIAGNQAAWLLDLITRTPAEGGTNLEEALKLAGSVAERHRAQIGQDRIVLLTDGAANLGNADPAQLATMIEQLRQKRIAFDACGIGRDGIDDSVLEPLTRKGDGRYYVLTSPADADAGFARQLAGAFRPAAENVKVQVRFNPARVGNYRLIGFEQHRLREEDFRNDHVDAAELAAEEAAVALYQIEVLPQGEGEIGEVFVRFRDPATAAMVERSWTIAHEPRARAFDRATPTLQLAGTAALLAEKLRGSSQAQQFKLGDFAGVVNALRGHYAQNRRVQELVTMFGQMRQRSGE